MATIYREIALPVSADHAWKFISQLDRAHEMMSFLKASTVKGDRRVCDLEDGGKLDEWILSVDEKRHRVAYSIQASPFSMEFHAASMQIVDGHGGPKLVWTTDLKPDALADQLSPMIDSEIDNIKAAFERDGD